MRAPEMLAHIEITQGEAPFTVRAVDTHTYRSGKQVIYTAEASGDTPLDARNAAAHQEDVAERHAVVGGVATAATGLGGAALIVHGVMTRDAVDIVSGIGMLGLGERAVTYMGRSGRRRNVAGQMRQRLTTEFNLPDRPEPKAKPE